MYKYTRKQWLEKHRWMSETDASSLLATKPESDKESKDCKRVNGQCIHSCYLLPPKEELEVEELELVTNLKLDCYEIDGMRHEDSRMDVVAEKINSLIKAHNALVKEVKR